ncbi:hypothetical protein N836_09205 [Leptolyngbya sp. Heron Island J]|uniref:hypothetical protein n=1 Tax=Leptolyngbya sp. Heron Island J TaxID=1385935 RepID=UPI0003B96979|nr:hypothetical protein [Leptolyngbya sp. Heron Island J]ESA35989.1 hypothetical protein N836_09205 [Leptolyngbya sp. Heron Island J]
MSEREPDDPSLQSIIEGEGLPPEMVDQAVDELFKMFKSGYGTICIRLAEKLLDEAVRIARERTQPSE